VSCAIYCNLVRTIKFSLFLKKLFHFPRNLAKEQKEYLLKFARLEKDRQGSVDGLSDKTEVEEAGSGGDESGSGEDGKGGFKFKWFGS
jgi:hypothetical protein